MQDMVRGKGLRMQRREMEFAMIICEGPKTWNSGCHTVFSEARLVRKFGRDSEGSVREGQLLVSGQCSEQMMRISLKRSAFFFSYSPRNDPMQLMNKRPWPRSSVETARYGSTHDQGWVKIMKWTGYGVRRMQ